MKVSSWFVILIAYIAFIAGVTSSLDEAKWYSPIFTLLILGLPAYFGYMAGKEEQD